MSKVASGLWSSWHQLLIVYSKTTGVETRESFGGLKGMTNYSIETGEKSEGIYFSTNFPFIIIIVVGLIRRKARKFVRSWMEVVV
jgi:hypothetical protein